MWFWLDGKQQSVHPAFGIEMKCKKESVIMGGGLGRYVSVMGGGGVGIGLVGGGGMRRARSRSEEAFPLSAQRHSEGTDDGHWLCWCGCNFRRWAGRQADSGSRHWNGVYYSISQSPGVRLQRARQSDLCAPGVFAHIRMCDNKRQNNSLLSSVLPKPLRHMENWAAKRGFPKSPLKTGENKMSIISLCAGTLIS